MHAPTYLGKPLPATARLETRRLRRPKSPGAPRFPGLTGESCALAQTRSPAAGGLSPRPSHKTPLFSSNRPRFHSLADHHSVHFCSSHRLLSLIKSVDDTETGDSRRLKPNVIATRERSFGIDYASDGPHRR
ncbi:hypothetical protein MRX96_022446 [Rhipicephalus microplus]